MSVFQIIGTVLMVAGIVALPVFHYMGRSRPDIAKRHTLIDASALLGIVLGGLFFMAGW
ncbi:MAG TPA: hypothetical protein VKB69_04655 [Micromonosporaceae bacterium]|nr:hypothetical protein [Micromonosporaceae bacterium]